MFFRWKGHAFMPLFFEMQSSGNNFFERILHCLLSRWNVICISCFQDLNTATTEVSCIVILRVSICFLTLISRQGCFFVFCFLNWKTWVPGTRPYGRVRTGRFSARFGPISGFFNFFRWPDRSNRPVLPVPITLVTYNVF